VTSLVYASFIGRIGDANSVPALERLSDRRRRQHAGDQEAAALLELIRLKRLRLGREN
jgi:hypothetical protein